MAVANLHRMEPEERDKALVELYGEVKEEVKTTKKVTN